MLKLTYEKTTHFIILVRVWLVIKFKKLFSYFFINIHGYTKYVILCEGRTGSTLLHTYLNSHINVQSYGDILNRIPVNSNTLKENIFHPHPKNIMAVGFKLFYGYHDNPSYNAVFDQIVHDEQVKIIHLTRNNSLRMFASLKIAQKTGEWTKSWNSTPLKAKQVSLNMDETIEFINQYGQRKNLFNKLFENHHLLNVSFEELVYNSQDSLNTIQKFLSLPHKRLISAIKKQNPEPLSELISNFDKIKNQLPKEMI